MSDLPITPNPTVHTLICGHFIQGRAYKNWRPSGTNDWLLIATLDGAGRFGHTDGSITTRPGDFVLLGPGTLHDYSTAPEPGRWELLWAHFRPPTNWGDILIWPEEAPGLMRLPIEDSEIRDAASNRLFDALKLASGALRQRERFAMNALEETLLWCDSVTRREGRTHRVDPRIHESMEYLCGALAESIALDELAERSGLSVSRYSHLFRKEVGVTPQQFHENQRMARAGQLLAVSGHSVGDIASQVGFDNPFYFSIRFKRFSGVCPRDYRSRFR